MSKERPRVRFLVPVWGESYITRFLDLSLPSFLAPGNLPGLAELSDLEICILTVASQKPLFERNRAFQRMRAIAPIHFIDIDDLVVDQMYGITLTLAYLRGVTDVGPAMTEQFFLFMNADLLLADGSLVGVARKIL